MGGRGASIGTYVWRGKQREYGSEYHTLFTSGNIKFIEPNDSSRSVTAPQETRTSGRVYVTVDGRRKTPAYISYYDKGNKKAKTIDLIVPHKGVLPHVHHGLDHRKNDQPKGYANLTTEEKRMVERVMKMWNTFNTER